MSSTLTVRERLTLCKWADSLGGITPTLTRGAQWVKSEFGKDVPEADIRTVLDRADMTDDFHAYNDGEIGPLIRPGFGKNFYEMPADDAAFPSAVQEWKASTLIWAELAIMWFVEKITNKPDWHVKVFNEEIIAKWKQEVMAVDWEAVGLKHAYFNNDLFQFSLAELREKAKLYEATGLIPIFDASSVVIKSDNAITPEVKEELRKGVAVLENVPEKEKDWHPGSDGKVLDIVHPSLWPLVFGKSRIVSDKRILLKDTLAACGTGEIIPVPKKRYTDHHSSEDLWSVKFQWLPCDIDIDEGKPKIMSYINNLHPRHHAGLYTTIEKVLEKALPMWDLIYRWHEDYETLRIPCEEVETQCLAECTNNCCPENRPLDPDEDERPENVFDDDWQDNSEEPDREVWRRDEIWFNATHPAKQPPVPEYKPMALQPNDVNLESGFFNHADRIQVIVKLANIHLTPEKPTYDGGSWHIEGQLNEHIAATALYYYDNENITDSHLAFRTVADKEDLMGELSYQQGDHHSIDRTFGIDSRGDTNLRLGSVLTREDRLLAFPNVYQHRVAPFELVDKTRAGHRKILALFLVDPRIPIIGTANVPPQQKGWWKEGATEGARLGSLPPEITDMVFDNTDFPIGIEEAKELRAELMKERTTIAEYGMETITNGDWNFCEH
ncbi:hypothetical protein CORC01_00911 [Colletotrichum orchidophilum]|uniref:Uncharacterized protein n=1 Tax=Colletotrichum orchidophilum TaxID=1209926 RepID=A0A1G4BQ46_9PEZI|nr:uncharacterized protein CORC01_00911 [Colletotrichum orchidophilum]OHF03592.1 hypothetical protein CORC01_00911 [Colletotrichum orchidophilum]